MRFIHFVSCFLVAAYFVFAPPVSASSTSSGISRDFNPAISVNSLLLYSSGSLAATDDEHEEHAADEHEHHHATAAGFAIQETELQFTANVDPYSKAVVTLAMHGTSGIEAEECFIQLQRLPARLGLRAGQFMWQFGKHNSLHTHQYPFVERPHAWDELLGEHGLSGVALELSWLSPLPWFAELTGTAMPLTQSMYTEAPDSLATVPENKWSESFRLHQLLEISQRSTLGLGLSWLHSDVLHAHEDELEVGDRDLYGIDLTWKWTGAGRSPRQVEIQGEWLRRKDTLPDEEIAHYGWFLSGRTKLTRRFWVGSRLDRFEPQEADDHDHVTATSTITASLAFVPSEFSAWRLDLLRRSVGDEDINGLRMQLNMTIGSHPAHRY